MIENRLPPPVGCAHEHSHPRLSSRESVGTPRVLSSAKFSYAVAGARKYSWCSPPGTAE
jgi:hypothetical protein